jgi:CheY-like chemotaxis protein
VETPVPSLTDARILLVEDNPINLKIGSEMLRMAGVSVDTAQNGLEAIEKVQKNQYAAVLIDIQMPHLDGIEASRIIRQQFSRTRLPIIAMSAHAKADNWKACLEAGINDYVLKPISRNVLFTALKNQIGPGHKLSVPESEFRSRRTLIRSDAEMEALPGLDIRDGLERLGGEAAVYAEILSDFCQTYAGFQQEMKPLIQDASFTRAADLSHSLKGASGNVSATDLFDSVKALEQACRQKNESEALSLLASVQSAYETVCESAKQFCGQIESLTPIEKKAPSSSVLDTDDKNVETLARSLMDSIDQCDPVLSDTLIRQLAPLVQETWKNEMDQLIDAVKNYRFEDARTFATILIEKAGGGK